MFGHLPLTGSHDCIHLPWQKCTWKLQTECKNKYRGVHTVVFEVLDSHPTRVLHITDMYWGCCVDSLIVKYEEAVH
jgi:hypothetical protein